MIGRCVTAVVKLSRILVAASILIVTGCPRVHVPYQPVSEPDDLGKLEIGYQSGPGYQIAPRYLNRKEFLQPADPLESPDLYFVQYKCVDDTYKGRYDCRDVETLALYRSAELALEKGFPFFAVLEDKAGKGCMRAFPPSCGIYFYYAWVRIQMFHEASVPSMVGWPRLYNARQLVESLQSEYPLLCEGFLPGTETPARCKPGREWIWWSG